MREFTDYPATIDSRLEAKNGLVKSASSRWIPAWNFSL